MTSDVPGELKLPMIEIRFWWRVSFLTIGCRALCDKFVSNEAASKLIDTFVKLICGNLAIRLFIKLSEEKSAE